MKKIKNLLKKAKEKCAMMIKYQMITHVVATNIKNDR